jgi:transcription-repair coupling factor (superfamily II helicase)
VHKDHGIGKFRKLDRYMVDESDIDVAVIEYADDSILYMPLYNIHKIDKYRAGEDVTPVLDQIGGKTWGRKKRSVKKRIDRMVKKILELYARREIASGHSFSSDTEVHREFYSFFPYEETADQIKSINDIFHDMESGRVMDRLLCGDVGFGKTEVAMRSVFKAVYDGKQVAVIVPTTVLCEQHYRNFNERFSAFPVAIDFISRFKTPAQIRDTIERVERGEVDIVIGTHALLKRDITFRDLGLMVIDEEHRFGVAQKERIKELKKGVDCLMMSATPIPRTLQMAMSGIREMSIIETPPEERLSVKTVVARFDKELIRDAVTREIVRGGQVFFVHNRIKDILRIKEILEKLLPDVRIISAHGQMRTKELEDIMVGFMKHDFDMLVCTSIIGSGIDIPTANTIFIDSADRFGLADLYQLKGRVGRGSVKAYAYLLVDQKSLCTVEGKRRLKAIEQLSYLGAGLKLALKDLERRGAGTLFGYKQSGYIRELGFDMYMDLLKKEVQRLRGETVEDEIEPEIDLNIHARIPESYVHEDMLRMSLYRRMASLESDEDLDEFGNEIEDRFGTVPDDMQRLLSVISLKIMAKRIGVQKLSLDSTGVSITFSSKDKIRMERFFTLAEQFTGIRYRQDGFDLQLKDHEWSGIVASISHIFNYLSRELTH